MAFKCIPIAVVTNTTSVGAVRQVSNLLTQVIQFYAESSHRFSSASVGNELVLVPSDCVTLVQVVIDTRFIHDVCVGNVQLEADFVLVHAVFGQDNWCRQVHDRKEPRLAVASNLHLDVMTFAILVIRRVGIVSVKCHRNGIDTDTVEFKPNVVRVEFCLVLALCRIEGFAILVVIYGRLPTHLREDVGEVDGQSVLDVRHMSIISRADYIIVGNRKILSGQRHVTASWFIVNRISVDVSWCMETVEVRYALVLPRLLQILESSHRVAIGIAIITNLAGGIAVLVRIVRPSFGFNARQRKALVRHADDTSVSSNQMRRSLVFGTSFIRKRIIRISNFCLGYDRSVPR